MIRIDGKTIISLFIFLILIRSFWAIGFDVSKSSWRLIFTLSLLVSLFVPINIDLAGIFKIKSQIGELKKDVEDVKGNIIALENKQSQEVKNYINLSFNKDKLPQQKFEETLSATTQLIVENEENNK